jgi:regulator of replication initiation timing
MAQQISVEDALDAFRKRHGEVADENVLLRAQVAGLERRLSDALQENERLHQAAAAVSVGPDLAAQPPYETPDRG